MQRDLLVLTDQSIRANQKTSLTYRLVLPSQVTYDFPLPTMHDFRIWWAERSSGKVYLKACLDGCSSCMLDIPGLVRDSLWLSVG